MFFNGIAHLPFPLHLAPWSFLSPAGAKSGVFPRSRGGPYLCVSPAGGGGAKWVQTGKIVYKTDRGHGLH